MFGGFRERAEQTYRVLQAPETAFLVVAAPEPDAVREAAYFAGRLAAERMPLAGLVLNRVTGAGRRPDGGTRRAAATAWTRWRATRSPPTCCGSTPEIADRRSGGRQSPAGSPRAHPGVPVAKIAAQPADVHDLDGLRAIGTSC